MSLLFSLALLSLILWVSRWIYKRGSREPGLPPGPATLPFIGNLHIFPTSRAHLRFTEWAKSYGDICSVKIGPQTVVIISSPKLARECFDSNSATTSDRPVFHVMDLIFEQKELALSRYGPYWRNMRRAAHRLLNKDASLNHVPIQYAEATLLMHNLLVDPSNLYNHMRRYAASVALSVAFGIHCPSTDDPLIVELFQTNMEADHLVRPGGHPPMEILPFLKYVPERWASWKRICVDIRTRQQNYYSDLLNRCRERIEKNKHNGSFMEYLLEHGDEYNLDQKEIHYFGLSMILAGADTTGTFLQFFVLCMLQHPDVLRKAQQEIDTVIGAHRTPDLEDFDNLPYIQAIIHEVHRYCPVAPTGVPHAATADTVVGGYLIPNGSTIFMNIWGICRNEDLYDDPETFDPERFMKSPFGIKADTDPAGFRDSPLTFGGGRRICPGRHIAANSIALNVMNLLWAFDIKLLKDPDTGLPIPLDDSDHAHDGILLTPNPFACDIRPRSEERMGLIRKQPTFDRFEKGKNGKAI